MPTAALNRVAELLDPTRTLSTVDISHGYLDLIGDTPPPRRTLALSAMRSTVLPAIYERWWRPAVQLMHGRHRLDQAGEQRVARELLELRDSWTVLDVACGPGNFTRSFAPAVGEHGLVVGIDESATMLAKAAEQEVTGQKATGQDATGQKATGQDATGQDASGTVGYVRGDARDLPFRNGVFDAVGCFLALHLIPEPFRAVAELVRVLAPGGRVAVMAPYRPGGVVPRVLDRALTAGIGIRSFGRDELTGALERAGAVAVERRLSGLLQFVSASKPS